MDGMTEACIKGGIEACYAAVSCVCTLLGALDELSQGKGLNDTQVQQLLLRLEELRDGAESSRDSMEINEADFRWQRRVLSSEHTPWESGNERSPDISISVTTDTGQTTLEGELGQTTPEDHKNGLKSPAIQEGKGTMGKVSEPEAIDQPDVVQRSHTVPYPDITNFLSVDCRTRSYGSRYSESNFIGGWYHTSQEQVFATAGQLTPGPSCTAFFTLGLCKGSHGFKSWDLAGACSVSASLWTDEAILSSWSTVRVGGPFHVALTAAFLLVLWF